MNAIKKEIVILIGAGQIGTTIAKIMIDGGATASYHYGPSKPQG